MPPQRTIPAAKPVKTERTHEENQERSVFFECILEEHSRLTMHLELTLPHLEEVTEASRRESNPLDERPRFTNDEPVGHSE